MSKVGIDFAFDLLRNQWRAQGWVRLVMGLNFRVDLYPSLQQPHRNYVIYFILDIAETPFKTQAKALPIPLFPLHVT